MIEYAPLVIGALCALGGYIAGQLEAESHYREELIDARLQQQKWQRRFRQLADHGRLDLEGEA